MEFSPKIDRLCQINYLKSTQRTGLLLEVDMGLSFLVLSFSLPVLDNNRINVLTDLSYKCITFFKISYLGFESFNYIFLIVYHHVLH